MMPEVKIYSSRFCGYCTRAKMLLDKKGITFIEMSVDQDPQLREEMIQRAGRTSVPQIFIGEDHVGGCDDLYAMDVQGELDKRLGII